jgi:hypothetical protein
MTPGWILLLVLGAVPPAQAKRPARFVGQLPDGSQVERDALANWHAPDAIPTLDGRALLDAANPLLWLLDQIHLAWSVDDFRHIPARAAACGTATASWSASTPAAAALQALSTAPWPMPRSSWAA